MSPELLAWAQLWGVPYAALVDLQQRLVSITVPETLSARSDEAVASKHVRLEAARKGMVLWRNNVGAATDENGNHFRFGLANDSHKMSKHIKSHDLIGIRPLLIQQHHVGQIIGQFLSREMKRPGWQFTGTEREQAQAKFAALVQSLGGDAAFATGEGTL